MSRLGSSTRYCSRCLSTFEEDHERCPNLSCRRPKPGAGWGRMYGPGDVFDRHYKIHNLLALGGAGVTYLAREVGVDGEEIGPRLALKVLFATRDEGSYLRRLATEAQILQELDHPNIVQYLGFVHRAGHSPYLVTRFEAGGSLLDHIKRVGSLNIRRACQVGRQICWALDKAHPMGIVHRDLKPENVLLARVVGPDEDPVVRVADFGIAKVQGSLAGVTRVGAFVGTPQYAAPEQFIGATPTPATDVYAVGAVMYFCTMVMSVVRFADRLDPEESYNLLCDTLPPVVERSHDDPDDVRRFNRVLEVCMAVDARDRCDIEQLDALLGAVASGREPDLSALGGRWGNLVSSPTLTADPDTFDHALEPIDLAGASGANPGGSAPDHPSRLPTPVPTPTEDDAAEAAAEAAAAAAPPPVADAPTPTSGVSSAATPAATSGPTPAPTRELPADARPDLDPTADTPAAPAPTTKPRRKRGCCGPFVLLVGLLGASLVIGGWFWMAWTSPRDLPTWAQLAPVTLDPGAEEDQATVAVLTEALIERLATVRERCDPDVGAITVVLVVQPGGQVTGLNFKSLTPGLDADCIGQALIAERLPSPGWRPVRMGIALDLSQQPSRPAPSDAPTEGSPQDPPPDGAPGGAPDAPSPETP